MVRSIYVFPLSPFRPPKGPFVNDACKIFGIFYPLPVCPQNRPIFLPPSVRTSFMNGPYEAFVAFPLQ